MLDFSGGDTSSMPTTTAADFTGGSSSMTQAQKLQMAQLAAQMLQSGFKQQAPSMAGQTLPQSPGLSTQTLNAGQIVGGY